MNNRKYPRFQCKFKRVVLFLVIALLLPFLFYLIPTPAWTALPQVGGVFSAIISLLGLVALGLGWRRGDRTPIGQQQPLSAV